MVRSQKYLHFVNFVRT